ncbi:uncharacterized protein LOC142890974 isoform X7 [Nelusetta ayraudi]
METKKWHLTAEQDALEHILHFKDKSFLEERPINAVDGSGVFTQKAIKPSEFVVEYRGNIFMCKDGSPSCKQANAQNSHLMEFSWEGEQWCVDASNEDEALGRLVNHDDFSPNCEMRQVVCEGKPHLCLFAVREIFPDDEITYCHGDSTNKQCSQALETASSLNNNAESSENDDGSDDKRPRSKRVRQSLRSGLRSRKVNSNPFNKRDDDGGSSSDGLELDEDYSHSAAQGSSKGSRRTPTNYCYVCGATSTKIARHLKTHIQDEPDIAKAFSFRKRSQNRKKSLSALRNLGNYKHNQEVLRTNSGTLRMSRQPPLLVGSKDIAHCPHCKGTFVRCNLWRHIRRCSGEVPTPTRKALVAPMFPFAVKEMLSVMKQDKVTSVVQSDFLLAHLALNLCKKYKDSPDKHGYVRQTLRDLGRLLIALQEKSIPSFKNAIKPKNVYKVIVTVKHMAGFKKDLQRFSKPSLALRLRHSLKRMATIALVEANAMETEGIEKFNEMSAVEWRKLSGTLPGPEGKASNPSSTVLFTRDAQLFYKYLEAAFVVAVEGLKAEGKTKAYVTLCRVTVALTSILNTCAPQVSEMTLNAFHERDKSSQVLSKHFIHVNLPSGTAPGITVLLTSELVDAITLLASKREACGVHESNPFLFAKPNLSPSSFFRGVNSIKAFSNLCQAKNPEQFVSKNLQKHIARVFQILNLENDELSHLAKLLGLEIRTDKDYYRLPEAAEELAKIAKLLLAMEKGSLEKLKGNSLEDIHIEDESEADGERGCTGDDGKDKTNSTRQPGDQTKKITPKQDALEHICAHRDKPFLKETFINTSKGRGVITQEIIEPSTFVVEFRGRITSHSEKKNGNDLDKFVYHYSWKGTNWCVDASNEDGSLGRLVNDEHVNPNCKMRTVVCEGKPHLCLFAVKKICPGEEITYNYGKPSYPWRSEDDPGGQSCSAESCCDEEDEPPGQTHSGDASCKPKQDGLESSNSGKRKRSADELRGLESFENTWERAPKNPKSYVLCLYCKCMYKRHFMSRHIRVCPSKPSSVSFTARTKRVLDLCAAAEVLDHREISLSLEELIKTMKDDEITAAIQAEPVILQVACHNGSEITNHSQIMRKLRIMGKFLLLLKKSSVHSLDDATRPQNFVKFAKTIRRFVGFDPRTKSCKESTWRHLSEWLKKCVDVMLARALMEDTDKSKLWELETFAKLCWEELIYISPEALTPMATVLFVRDVQLLHRFMEETASSALQSLRMCACAPVYTALLRVTMAQVSVLNDRPSNFSRITLESFKQRGQTKAEGRGEERRPPVLPRPLVTVHVHTSTGKALAMVVTPDLLTTLELLVSQREVCGVCQGDPHLFAIPNHKPRFLKAHLNLCLLIRRSDAVHKKNLRSHGFHTQVVRIIRILSLTAEGLEELAQQLGRDIPRDPAHYRAPQAAIDVAKISELLKDGALERFEGKSLEEIEIADEVEQDRPRSSDTEDDGDSSEDTPRKRFPPRKRGRKPRKKMEEEEESSAEASQQNDEAIVDKPDEFEKMPESCDIGTPDKAPCDDDITKMSFSDDDMDMNVDFDLGVETGDNDDYDYADDAGGEHDDDDEDDRGAPVGRMDSDTARCSETKDQRNQTDLDLSGGITVRNAGVGSHLAAALVGMKQARILLTKLDIASFATPVSKSVPPPACSPVSSPVNSQPQCDDDGNSEQPPTPTAPTPGNKEAGTPPAAQAAQVACFSCKKIMMNGQAAFQKKGTADVFCSKTCLFHKFPSNRTTTKTCHRCQQAITEPQDLIMAAVDVKGTMKDFCSIPCLSSFKSKAVLTQTTQSACSASKKPCNGNFVCTLKVNGSSVCQGNPNIVMKNCFNCLRAITQRRNMILIPVDHFGTKKELCSSACLNSLKSRMPQLACKMCCIRGNFPFRKTLDGLELIFCSEVCFIKYHKTNKIPVFICDVCTSVCPKKHLVLKMQQLSKIVCGEDCLHKFKEEVEAPQQCQRCQMFHQMSDMVEIENDEGCLDFFCSNRCMMVHKSLKFSEKQGQNLEDAAGVDMKLTLRELNCIKEEPVDEELDHNATLASATECVKTEAKVHKLEEPEATNGVAPSSPPSESTSASDSDASRSNCKMQQTVPAAPMTRCSMCSKNCTSKHEIIQKGVVYLFCSQPCFLRFCSFNSVPVCQSCYVHCDASIMLRLQGGTRRLCSAACLAQFKQENKTLQPCSACTSQCLMSDMVEDKSGDGALTLFCSSRCVIASKIQNVQTTDIPLRCDHCCKAALPACHLAMADASIRNFCSLSCAMTFKENQNDAPEPKATSQQTHCEFLQDPDDFPCASCSRVFTAAPQVIQTKGKTHFVCSPLCVQAFKEANSITARCEYCKNEQIAKETKWVDNKERHFCSEGCGFLFRAKLQELWGEHCSSCACCLSTTKTVVSDFYRDKVEHFCSQECNTKYNKLLCHLASCDTCGHEGKLSQSLPIPGDVKHFCDLKCLLHFCHRKVSPNDTGPPAADATEPSPVISSVMSLAEALESRHHGALAQTHSLRTEVPPPGSEVIVCTHASVQTAPKELKNKSVLCTPLVHNKGVLCKTEMLDSETQTDKIPNTAVPVPVPVYVPVPMSMYSQCTPKTLVLPLLLPVPIFLSARPGDPAPLEQPAKPSKQSEPLEGKEVPFKSQQEMMGPDENGETGDGRLNGAAATEEDGEASADDHHPACDNQEPSVCQLDSLFQMESKVEVHRKNKETQPSSAATRSSSRLRSRRCHEQGGRPGINAWKRWTQWRQSQTNLYLLSALAVTLNEDILRCSPAELSEGLVCFVTEAKRSDGRPYTADRLLYLCLDIQKYLFDKSRTENIFFDPIYNKFSEVLTRILRGFSPSARVQSCVEEAFLWESKQLGAYSPVILLNTLLYFCSKHFGLTTVEQHRQLSFAHVMRCTKTNPDRTKTTYMRFYPPLPGKSTESDGIPAKKCKPDLKEKILEVPENKDNPLQCPVKFHEFYLSKCSDASRERSDTLYLQPLRSCVPSSPVWFSTTPLDDHTLGTMLVQISAVRELHASEKVQTSDGKAFVSDEDFGSHSE